jgi:hypothetical protein
LNTRYVNYPIVVVDDVRFENEYALIKRREGTLIRVDREAPPDTVAHNSNDRLSGLPFHYTIKNDGSVDDLVAKARVVAWDLGITGDV